MNKGAIMSMCLAMFFNNAGRRTDEEIIGDYIMEGRNKLTGASKKIAAAFADDACYQCGACCKEMPCQYGEWDEEAHQCRNLAIDRQTASYTTYKCNNFQSIQQAERDKKYPMFGGGCYRPMFNKDRDHIIQCKQHIRRSHG